MISDQVHAVKYMSNIYLILSYLQIIKHRLVINLSNNVKQRKIAKNGEKQGKMASITMNQNKLKKNFDKKITKTSYDAIMTSLPQSECFSCNFKVIICKILEIQLNIQKME